jgi:hypothetical protein
LYFLLEDDDPKHVYMQQQGRDIDDPALAEFLQSRLRVAARDIRFLCKTEKNDSAFRFHNVTAARKYLLVLTRRALLHTRGRSLTTLCPCVPDLKAGRPPRAIYTVYDRTGNNPEQYDTPFYNLYVFATVSIACAVQTQCRACGAPKYIARVPRSHILDKSLLPLERFVLDTCALRFHTDFVAIEDPAWPNTHVPYVKYNPRWRPVYLNNDTVTDIVTRERYVAPVCMPMIRAQDPPAALFIQSPCGSGKSQFAVQAICTLHDRGLLPNGVFLPVATKAQAAAHTAAFSRAYEGFVFGQSTHPADLGILHYRYDEHTVGHTCASRGKPNNIPATSFGNLSSICTINSMVKHFIYTDPVTRDTKIHVPSLVWMDETVSLFDALCLSDNMKTTHGGRTTAIRVFEHIIAHCDFIIATDAYLDSPCVDYVSAIRERAGKLDARRIVRFSARFLPYNVYIHQNRDAEFLHHVAFNINAGKRCLVLSDSKQVAFRVYNGVREVCPGKALRLYTADTADTIKDNDFANCNDVWPEVDALFATPALTTGVNFTRRHFHVCFFYASGLSVSARTSLQMMNRARSYVDGDIFVYSPVRYTLNQFPLSQSDAAALCQDVLARDTVARDLDHPDEDQIAPQHTPLCNHVSIDNEHRVVYDPVAKLAVRAVREHQQSRTDFSYELAQIALYSGYSVMLCVPTAARSTRLDHFLTATGLVDPQPQPPQPPQPQSPEPEQPDEDDEDMALLAAATETATMRDAHENSQSLRFERIAAIQLPDTLEHQRQLSADHIEERHLYNLKILTGLLPSEPVSPAFVAAFFDKPKFAAAMRFLAYTCAYSFTPAPIVVDLNEAEFHKRLRPSPTYFVWALMQLSCIMLELGLFPQGTHGQIPFVATMRTPCEKHRRVLPLHIRDTIRRNLPIYHTQFERPLAKHTVVLDPTTQTLSKLFTSAMRCIGVTVSPARRKLDRHTLYNCTPTDPCELFLVAATRPVALKHTRAIAPRHNIDMLMRLATFVCAARPDFKWNNVHRITHDDIIAVFAQHIDPPPGAPSL